MTFHQTWVRSAVRAQQAITLERYQQTLQSRGALEHANQTHDKATKALVDLVSSWDALSTSARLDSLVHQSYQRFEEHLRQRKDAATRFQHQSQQAADAAEAHLRSSLHTEQVLEDLASQQAQRRLQEACHREQRTLAEAWLLTSFSRQATPCI